MEATKRINVCGLMIDASANKINNSVTGLIEYCQFTEYWQCIAVGECYKADSRFS